jgi:DNA repair protein RadC
LVVRTPALRGGAFGKARVLRKASGHVLCLVAWLQAGAACGPSGRLSVAGERAGPERAQNGGRTTMTSTEEMHLIREVAIRYVGARRRVPNKITRPEEVAQYLRRRVRDDAREHFVAIYLDGRHRPIADSVVSIGTATASLVHPREVFQPAIALGSVALLIAHNHPSGDVTPSAEDLDLTRRLAEAGRILGVTLLDHVVWARRGALHSIRESHPGHLSAAG